MIILHFIIVIFKVLLKFLLVVINMIFIISVFFFMFLWIATGFGLIIAGHLYEEYQTKWVFLILLLNILFFVDSIDKEWNKHKKKHKL